MSHEKPTERIARLETRQDILEQIQKDQAEAISSLDSKLDELVKQVSSIKMALIVIASAAALSVPWETKLSLIKSILGF